MRRLTPWLPAVALAATGTALILTAQSPPPPAAAAPPPAAEVFVPRPSRATTQVLGRSPPTALRIPAIGVDTRLIRLGLGADRAVEVPPLTGGAPAGWYRYSVTPGETGAAVILGHLDSARDGPEVFYRLGRLRPGDVVSVDRADGRTVRFAVTEVATYPKAAFPTERVYGPVTYAGLRLITCGGRFDRARRTYRDNVVVFARAVQ